jgi:hypothetical protein
MTIAEGSNRLASTPVREEGISLLELMISILAAVVILGAVLSASLHHASERKSNAELNLALVACTNNLEEMRSIPFEDLPGLDGEGFDIPGINGEPAGLQPLPGDLDGMPGQLTVVTDQSSGAVVLYLVRATVTWAGTLGRQRVELETLMGDRK